MQRTKKYRTGGGRPPILRVAKPASLMCSDPPVGATVQVAPWARFFARTIDLGVVTVLVFVAGVAMEMSLPTWSLGPLQAVLLGFLVFGIALLAYEAIALSEFGTTIGKAAFGLRIRTERGGVLDTASAFRRAFWVWVSGNGCYLAFPTASVFFWWRGYRLLKATGSTPWDKRAGTAVTQGSVGSFRFLAGASVSVALLVGTLLLATLSKQAFKQEFRAATSILDQLHGTPTRRGLSDEEFFGAAPSGRGLSDEEVFGTAAAKQ
jgi:uncharacterized RDD family membrane protein YckC